MLLKDKYKNKYSNAINTFYLYLQEEFTEKIYWLISPVITEVFLKNDW